LIAAQGAVSGPLVSGNPNPIYAAKYLVDVIDAIGDWATEGVGHKHGKGRSLKVTHGWMKSLVQ
tara:strand:+ start:421 stop:612 length:192 start_codon:yes stop_codon:yes gene_type:complete